jgi:hypothetical protein
MNVKREEVFEFDNTSSELREVSIENSIVPLIP